VPLETLVEPEKSEAETIASFRPNANGLFRVVARKTRA
jgi:hypothetical protein